MRTGLIDSIALILIADIELKRGSEMNAKHWVFILAVFFHCILISAANAGTEELLDSLTAQIENSEIISDELKEFTKDSLLPLCTNVVFVAAVEAQNAREMSLQEIKEIDKQWRASKVFLPIHREILRNECTGEILWITENHPIVNEMFVMDNQGAIVGFNNITSDYWQGDEAKWVEAYNGGKGGVYIAEPEFDKSTSTIDRKISLPIIDTTGSVIGAVCIGLRLEK